MSVFPDLQYPLEIEFIIVIIIIIIIVIIIIIIINIIIIIAVGKRMDAKIEPHRARSVTYAI